MNFFLFADGVTMKRPSKELVLVNIEAGSLAEPWNRVMPFERRDCDAAEAVLRVRPRNSMVVG